MRPLPATGGDPHGPAVAELLSALRGIHRALFAVGPADGGVDGLGRAPLALLRLIVQEPGQTLTGLAARAHVDPSSASITLNTLVDLELVVRERDGADRRKLQVHPTAAGRRIARRVPDGARDRLAAALHAIPAPRLAAFAGQMAQLHEALGEGEDGGGSALRRA